MEFYGAKPWRLSFVIANHLRPLRYISSRTPGQKTDLKPHSNFVTRSQNTYDFKTDIDSKLGFYVRTL